MPGTTHAEPVPSAPQPRTRARFLPSSHGVWARLSKVGERLDWPWLMYNPGIFRHFHQAALRNAPLFADAVLREYPGATSLIDVGCGSGAFAAEFQRRGLRTLGFEHSPRGRKIAASQGVQVRPFDLAANDVPDLRDWSARADLVMSTEVGEHIPSHLADAFVHFIAACGDRIVFTADQPKGNAPRGVGQVNEQPIAYWIAKFASAGFNHDPDRTKRLAEAFKASDASYYLHENLAVFERTGAPGPAAGPAPTGAT